MRRAAPRPPRPAPQPDLPATGAPAERELPRDPLGRVAVPPAAPVTDLADVLSPAAEQALRDKLIAFERERGSQIAVIAVPSTQPEPIADFTNRVGDAWKIGRRDVGDGVLIAVAVKDRKVWISVARALEGAIPDVMASRITRELMGPSFARGDFAGGINAGVDAVMKRIEGEALPTPAGIPRHKVDAGKDLMGALVPLVIFGTIVAGLMRRVFGTPGAAITSMGVGAIAGFLLTSLVIGVIAAVAVFLFSAFMGGAAAAGACSAGVAAGRSSCPADGRRWRLGRRRRRGGLEFRRRRRLRRRRWRQQLVGRKMDIGRTLRHWVTTPGAVRRAFPEDVLQRIRQAIVESEAMHSGEIRFAVEAALPMSYLRRDAPARERAQMMFSKLRVWDTEQNNGVLIYVELADHQIEIVADRGIGDARDRGGVERHRSGDARPFRQGVRGRRDRAVQAVGALLARHFPLAAGERNPNELPDQPAVL